MLEHPSRIRILQEAEKQFLRFGVKSVTMDQIALALGMSKKTIYQFFREKSALVYQVMANHQEDLQVVMDSIRLQAQDPVDEVLKISDHLSQMTAEMNPSVLVDIARYYPDAYQLFLEYKRKCLLESLVVNMRWGIEQKLYRNDIDLHILATLRLQQIEWAFDPNVFPSAAYSLQKVHEQLIMHFLFGICTLKGHKLINKYRNIIED